MQRAIAALKVADPDKDESHDEEEDSDSDGGLGGEDARVPPSARC